MEGFRPVRIGLVGYGKGGRFFHAPLIAAAAGCELTGVVTRSAERRDDLEHDYPGTPAYDGLAELASAGVDAVAISTPADTHVPLVLEAVSLGLPVVCDKPFALQSAAARQALEAARRAGVPLTVVPREQWGRLHAGHTTRLWPSERGDWTEFYTSFADAVRGRGAVPVDPWDAVAGLEVLEAAQRSAATGQVVTLGPGTAAQT